MTKVLILDDADPFFSLIVPCLKLSELNDAEKDEFINQTINEYRPHARIATALPNTTFKRFSFKKCWRDRYGVISPTLMEPDGPSKQLFKSSDVLLALIVDKELGIMCYEFSPRKDFTGSIKAMAARICKSASVSTSSLAFVLSASKKDDFSGYSGASIEDEMRSWLLAMDNLYTAWTGNEIYSALT